MPLAQHVQSAARADWPAGLPALNERLDERMIASTLQAKNTTRNARKNGRVYAGRSMPQCGHVFARSLTSLPHSRHGFIAIIGSFVDGYRIMSRGALTLTWRRTLAKPRFRSASRPPSVVCAISALDSRRFPAHITFSGRIPNCGLASLHLIRHSTRTIGYSTVNDVARFARGSAVSRVSACGGGSLLA